MGLIDIFPIQIYSHNSVGLPEHKSTEFIRYLNSIEYSPFSPSDKVSIDQRILDKEIFASLKNNILDHCKKYLNSQKHNFEDLLIASSWAYISKKNNQAFTFHRHANSYISGVYYITSGSDLIFNEEKYEELYGFEPSYNTTNNEPLNKFYKLPVKKDQIVIFPSNLIHAIDKVQSNELRMSIAFNIIPKGKFGKFTSNLYINNND